MTIGFFQSLNPAKDHFFLFQQPYKVIQIRQNVNDSQDCLNILHAADLHLVIKARKFSKLPVVNLGILSSVHFCI